MIQRKKDLGEFDGCRLLGSFANLDDFLVFPLDLRITGRLSTNVL